MFALGFVFLIVLPYWWVSSIVRKSQVATIRRETRGTQFAEITQGEVTRVGVDLNMGLPTIPAPTIPMPTIAMPPINVHVVMPTPQDTPTPQATSTPVYSAMMIFKYSYYNPKLGGINCFTWDASINDCVSPLANGEDYRNNYGVSLACPPDIALGTVFDVQYPPELKGRWICKDRGGAIVDDYLDFLDVAQRVPWNSVIAAYVYPPDAPMQQINDGSH